MERQAAPGPRRFAAWPRGDHARTRRARRGVAGRMPVRDARCPGKSRSEDRASRARVDDESHRIGLARWAVRVRARAGRSHRRCLRLVRARSSSHHNEARTGRGQAAIIPHQRSSRHPARHVPTRFRWRNHIELPRPHLCHRGRSCARGPIAGKPSNDPTHEVLMRPERKIGDGAINNRAMRVDQKRRATCDQAE